MDKPQPKSAEDKYALIRRMVNGKYGIGFYEIASALVEAGYYTGKDFDEREKVNDDINAVIASGAIRWSNGFGGLVPIAGKELR